MPVIIYLLEEGYMDYLTFDEIAAIQFDRINFMYDLMQEYYKKHEEHEKNGYLINLDAVYEYVMTLIPRNAQEWYRKAIVYHNLDLFDEEYNCLRKALK